MKQYYYAPTNLTYNFSETDHICVYIRRSNGKKKILFASLNPQSAFDFYDKFKVFDGDIKYLQIDNGSSFKVLLRQSGTGARPKNYIGVKEEVNFKVGAIPNMPNVPITLLNALKECTPYHSIPNTHKRVTRNKLICALLSYFVSLDCDQRQKLLEVAFKEYYIHKMKSGGNPVEEIKDIMAKVNDELL